MEIPIKTIYDVTNKRFLNDAGTEITDANLYPSAVFGQEFWHNVQLVSGLISRKYDKLPLGATAEILIDNDYSNPCPILPIPAGNENWTAGTGSEYYYNGTDITTKPVIVYFDDAQVVEGTKGSLAAGTWAWDSASTRLYVRLGDSTSPDEKTAGYVEFKETRTATNPFIEIDGDTFNAAGSWYDTDTQQFRDPVITDGELSYYVTAKTLQFFRRIGTSKEETGTTEQIQMIAPGTAINFIIFEFPFICRNKYLGQGYTLNITGSNIYTKAEVEALLREGRELQFSADGSNWHDTQDPETDLYWRERYPDGEWGEAVTISQTLRVRIQYSVNGSTDWHDEYTQSDFYLRFSRDVGVTWEDAILFRVNGVNGVNAFIYIGYASDNQGNGFSLIPTDSLKYRAEIHRTAIIADPAASDFQGAIWVKYLGDKGETGAAATVAIGEVNTVEPDVPAGATNMGTTHDAIWNLLIPRGRTGDIGNTGAAITSAEFVGDDIVFGRDFGGGVTLENAVEALRGPTGPDAEYFGMTFTSANLVNGVLTITHNRGLIMGLPGCISFEKTPGHYKSITLDDEACDWYLNHVDVDLAIYNIGSETWYCAFGARPGADGDDSIVPGPTGPTGPAKYSWFGFADSATGAGYTTAYSGQDYLGFSANQDTPFPPEEVTGAEFTWIFSKGNTGAPGAGSTMPGPKGETGADNTRTDIASYTGGHTMDYADKGVYMRFTGATTCTVIFPQGLTFSAGDKGDFFQAGAGTLSIAGMTGVYLNDVDGGSCDIAISRQGAFWVCTDSDCYDIGGTVTEVT